MFSTLRERMPPGASDDQVAVATARARQEGITPDRLERVAADPNDQNRVWLMAVSYTHLDVYKRQGQKR